jgi:uncharacterized protein YecE (DUF72 family)
MLPLFDEVPAESPRSLLADKLRQLATQHIFFGTSSWKYPGWLGHIYREDLYQTRGRFSQKKFDAECIHEYAEVFPVVCGDFSFYNIPTPDYWTKLFSTTPSSLQWAFKTPETFTVRQWPTHARYGKRGGLENEYFLDAGLFNSAFVEPLRPHARRLATIILEFGTFSKKSIPGGAPEFVDRLDQFLAQLPTDVRYAVEIRNPEYLEDSYLDCLRRHGVAHVMNAWTRMPTLSAQSSRPGIITADFTVARALLRSGRAYEQAVKMFEPYERVQEPNEEARTALQDIAERARKQKQTAFLFVNNRLEGNAPGTITAVADAL